MFRFGKQALTRRSMFAGAMAAPLLGQESPPAVRLGRKVRIALIGLEGHTGEILGPLARLPDVSLVAVADPDEKGLVRAMSRPPMRGARSYADYRRLLEREELDVAGVCGPNGGRAAVILDCLDRNLHVAAEKPIALNREELRSIREKLEARNLRMTMLLPMRFSSPYLALRRIVESGEIGEVLQIASQKSYKAGERPEWMRNHATYGGTIPWIGIHMIDLMRWTSGREFKEAFSLKAHIGFPELGDMENVTGSLFQLDNGGIAMLRMDYLRPETAASHGDDRLRLAGTLGVAEYQAATGVTVLAAKSAPRQVTSLPAEQSLFVDFLESVYKGKTPAIPHGDIYRVSEITLAAEESAVAHRAIKI
ncbi:MAG: Gfo/Idh/MocA family oxidoreductase [Bryobacteraceae bacterium]|nr:Gfo/Idh/MocA family oxidoreductase [Bryobacteraceae bacterium]